VPENHTGDCRISCYHTYHPQSWLWQAPIPHAFSGHMQLEAGLMCSAEGVGAILVQVRLVARHSSILQLGEWNKYTTI
jgi:hypothetical protein